MRDRGRWRERVTKTLERCSGDIELGIQEDREEIRLKKGLYRLHATKLRNKKVKK